MKTLVFVFLLLHVLSDGQRGFDFQKSKKGQFPFFANLFVPNKNNNSSSFLCGGSLIHPKWILTAAHCFLNVSRNDLEKDNSYLIKMGYVKSSDKNKARNKYQKIILHPDFQYEKIKKLTKLKNDVALVKLRKPYALNKYVNIVKLPSPFDSKKAKNCKIVIRINVSSKKSRKSVKGAHLQFIGVKISKVPLSTIGYDSGTTIFSVSLAHKLGALHGYLGNPLFCYPTPETPVQYGVIIQKVRSIQRDLETTVYENVEMHMGFIKENIPNLRVIRGNSETRTINKEIKKEKPVEKIEKIQEARAKSSIGRMHCSAFSILSFLCIRFLK